MFPTVQGDCERSRVFRMNGILCKTAEGANGFRPCDVFAGLPLQLCAAEDCPGRTDPVTGAHFGSLASSPNAEDDLGLDSDCAVFNAFGVLTGGVLLDAVAQTFVDFGSSKLFTPAATTASTRPSSSAAASAPREPRENADVCVASSLIPYNTHQVGRSRRKRKRVLDRVPTESEDCTMRQLRHVVEKMKTPVPVFTPEIAFPVQHGGAFLSRSQAVTAVAGAVPSTFTCFSGRPIWRRAFGPRRDPISYAKRPTVITKLVMEFTDAAHPTDQRVPMLTALTARQRLLSLPPALQGWSLHWWVFARFMAYLAVQSHPPAVLPVTEHASFYMAQASRVVEDVTAGTYKPPRQAEATRCWHLLMCQDAAALQLRLRRFETFFRFVTDKRSSQAATQKTKEHCGGAKGNSTHTP